MQCILLAGGLGTRLQSLGLTVPKALVPINGEPFASHQLRLLAQQGVDHVVYSIGFRGEQIRAFVGDGSAWGLRVSYVDEGTALRGTAGALRLVLDQGLMAQDFFVLYGDSYLPIEYRPVWQAHQSCGHPALMTVMRNENQWDTSNVLFEDGRVIYDKRRQHLRSAEMRHIDYGLSVLSQMTVSAQVTANTVCDLAEVFRKLSEAGELAGYEVQQRFYEIGSMNGIRDLEAYLKQKAAPSPGGA